MANDSHFWTIGGLAASISLIILDPEVGFKLDESDTDLAATTGLATAITGACRDAGVGFGAAACTGFTGAEIGLIGAEIAILTGAA